MRRLLVGCGCVVAFGLQSPRLFADEAKDKPSSAAAEKPGDIAKSPGGTGQPTSALTGPTPAARQTLKTVAALLPKYHVTRRPVDDEVAGHWIRNFLKALDGNKYYFDQADIDRFVSRPRELAQAARQGDVSFAYEVFKVYLERVNERTRLANEFLRGPFDFARDEEYVTDLNTTAYAANPAEVREAVRKQVKFDVLEQKIDGVSVEQAREKLARRYERFRRATDQTGDESLMATYLTNLAQAYDPLSAYFSASKLEDFYISFRQQFEGLGITLQTVDDDTVIVSTVPGGPSARDGRLRAGDRIVGVGQGESGPIVNVVGLPLSEVVSKSRGKAATVVRLQIVRKGQAEPLVFSLKRGRVQSLEAHGIVVERGRKADGTPLRVGYIDAPTLYAAQKQADAYDAKTVSRDVRSILEDPLRGLKAAGIDAVVLDLRKNDGGALNEAINLSGLFIGSGPVMQVKGADRNVGHYDSSEILTAWDGPLVVLTSRNTGSGAEIVAACLQDYGRALVVGDSSTSGGGTIQNIVDVGEAVAAAPNSPKLGALRITTQQFYRVNGDSTQIRGVAADVVLPSMTDSKKTGESMSVQVPFDQVAPIEHSTLGTLSAEQKTELRTLSEQRRQKSAGFRRLAADMARLDARRGRKSISLKEDKAREALAPIGETEPPPDKGKLFESTFYNDEVLNVIGDYLRLTKPAK